MKSRGRICSGRWLRTAIFVTLWLSVVPGAANASIFDLNNWNNIQLDASDDFVRVATGADCTGTNTICVTWFEGPIVEGPLAIGIDQFFFDNSPVANSTALVASAVTGNSVGWSFNFNGVTADGFGGFDSHKNQGPANSTLALVFTVVGSDAAIGTAGELDEFALHVRYGNSCSGWVSNRTTSSAESDPNCAPVPEPSVLILLGIGLVGIAIVRWGWRRNSAG